MNRIIFLSLIILLNCTNPPEVQGQNKEVETDTLKARKALKIQSGGSFVNPTSLLIDMEQYVDSIRAAGDVLLFWKDGDVYEFGVAGVNEILPGSGIDVDDGTGPTAIISIGNAEVTNLHLAYQAVQGGSGGAVKDESITAHDILNGSLTMTEMSNMGRRRVINLLASAHVWNREVTRNGVVVDAAAADTLYFNIPYTASADTFKIDSVYFYILGDGDSDITKFQIFENNYGSDATIFTDAVSEPLFDENQIIKYTPAVVTDLPIQFFLTVSVGTGPVIFYNIKIFGRY
jgi:hypothetical protein